MSDHQKRNPVPLDAPRRAVHLLADAQRRVRAVLDAEVTDVSAAEKALAAKTDAAVLAANAAPELLAYLEELAGQILTETGSALRRAHDGEDPMDGLTELHGLLVSLARDVRA